MSSDLRHGVVQQVVNRPEMVGEVERHRRRTRTKASLQTGNLACQRFVSPDEMVVQAKPLTVQQQVPLSLRVCPCASGEGSDRLTKGQVDALDEQPSG